MPLAFQGAEDITMKPMGDESQAMRDAATIRESTHTRNGPRFMSETYFQIRELVHEQMRHLESCVQALIEEIRTLKASILPCNSPDPLPQDGSPQQPFFGSNSANPPGYPDKGVTIPPARCWRCGHDSLVVDGKARPKCGQWQPSGSPKGLQAVLNESGAMPKSQPTTNPSQISSFGPSFVCIIYKKTFPFAVGYALLKNTDKLPLRSGRVMCLGCNDLCSIDREIVP